MRVEPSRNSKFLRNVPSSKVVQDQLVERTIYQLPIFVPSPNLYRAVAPRTKQTAVVAVEGPVTAMVAINILETTVTVRVTNSFSPSVGGVSWYSLVSVAVGDGVNILAQPRALSVHQMTGLDRSAGCVDHAMPQSLHRV